MAGSRGRGGERRCLGVFASRDGGFQMVRYRRRVPGSSLSTLAAQTRRLLLRIQGFKDTATSSATHKPSRHRRLSAAAAWAPCGYGDLIRHWAMVLPLKVPRVLGMFGNAGFQRHGSRRPAQSCVGQSEVLRGGQVCCLLAVEQHFRRGLFRHGNGAVCDTNSAADGIAGLRLHGTLGPAGDGSWAAEWGMPRNEPSGCAGPLPRPVVSEAQATSAFASAQLSRQAPPR